MEATQNRSAEFGLEPVNFRIDSTGWEKVTLADGTRVKRNPEGDVTELLVGPYAGEQHFTQQAALRETAKAGKRIPTKKEWGAIIKAAAPHVDPDKGWQKAPGLAEKLGAQLAGFRAASSVGCYGQGTGGYFWSSSSDGAGGCYVYFSDSGVYPAGLDVKTPGLSVRCLEN